MDLNDIDEMVDEQDKTEPRQEIVDTAPKDLWMLFGVGIFVLGAFSFYMVENTLDKPVSDLNVLNDVNVTEEHLALASNQGLILDSLTALQVQHICGVNNLVLDSNQLVENDQGVFVTYQCYTKVGDAT